MAEEKKDEGVGDPFKILVEEALKQQRNTMMDKFAQILQQLPKSGTFTSSSNSGSATSFKVQVNFEIPIFEGQIDVDVVDKWLNMLEGYFLFMIFLAKKILLLHFSKLPPTSRTDGKPTVSRRMRGNFHYFQLHPLGIHSRMPLRSSNTLFGAMRKNT